MVLSFYCSTLLLFYPSIVLPFFCSVLLLSCPPSVILAYFFLLLCSSIVLTFCCSTPLLFNCSTVSHEQIFVFNVFCANKQPLIQRQPTFQNSTQTKNQHKQKRSYDHVQLCSLVSRTSYSPKLNFEKSCISRFITFSVACLTNKKKQEVSSTGISFS